MLDAKKLLDQVLGSARAGDLSGLEAQARQLLGQAGGAANGGASRGGGNGDLLKGALAGGVVGLLVGNKKARKFAGRTAGTALKVGGLAAVAGLAYTAWRNRQAATGAPLPPPEAAAGATHLMPAGEPALLPPPSESPFSPANAPGGEDALARAVLVAMIQGAKADGHIDAQEQSRIFAHVEALELDAEAKAFVMDELAAPLDVEKVVRAARTPEMAAELYAASLLAAVPDHPAERAYLDLLAARLGLDEELAAEIERSVLAAT
ncbi:tellurite resistance TerB family protein [Salinarimonas ramus]|uniref:Protein YebE n=1 Tax=Salinarimonas ramus TaxID=690164 RepID=A0A917QA26_9HYPH|nr:tellurite resistance TerB family protein [Salinarimonas ramus]GGK38762.1 protein YebE [Salinarimonas ramus]